MMLDVIFVGYGPGTQQAVIRMLELSKHRDIKYLIIERNDSPGSSFKTYPVHKKLISNNKLYTGADPKSDFSERFDWNSIITKDKEILARNYSKDFYPDRSIIPNMMRDIHDKCKVLSNFDEECLLIDKKIDKFIVTTNKNSYESRMVVLATGFSERIVSDDDIRGISFATPYSKVKEKEYYRNKSVFIIGKGNSAMECASDIMNEANMILIASPRSLKFAYKTHYVGNVRLVNSIPIENYQLKSLSAILDAKVIEISKSGNKYLVEVLYEHAKNERETIEVDEVINATGFVPNIPIISDDYKTINGKFPSITGDFESTEISNLFFAGALTHGLDYKQYSSSGFIHGFRYNSLTLAKIIVERIFDESIYFEQFGIGQLKSKIFDVMNNNPGIYLQPGFIGYSICADAEYSFQATGYKTKKSFVEGEPQNIVELLITLEYGDINSVDDVLSIERTPGEPSESLHIHPVVRIKNRASTVEYVLDENLFNKFDSSNINNEIMDKLIMKVRAMLSGS